VGLGGGGPRVFLGNLIVILGGTREGACQGRGVCSTIMICRLL
jgi:hypothetical protein